MRVNDLIWERITGIIFSSKQLFLLLTSLFSPPPFKVCMLSAHFQVFDFVYMLHELFYLERSFNVHLLFLICCWKENGDFLIKYSFKDIILSCRGKKTGSYYGIEVLIKALCIKQPPGSECFASRSAWLSACG